MSEFTEQAFSRNLGFMNETEQQRLHESSVAIAGAGGDGGMLAVQIARMGVGELRLADPDPFEIENLNRQAVCTTETLGMNKAEAVAEYVQKINPELKISVFDQGITETNTAEFVKGTNLVIDETEFTIHALGVMLAREARNEGVVNLMAMNIGFGSTVTAFHPEGKTFEEMLGFSKNASIQEIKAKEPSLSRWLPYIPPYADMEVFKKVATGEKSAPSIAPGVAMAAGKAATEAFLHLVGDDNRRAKPVFAPKVHVVDAMTGKSKTVKHPLLSHYGTLSKMAARNVLKMNPSASY